MPKTKALISELRSRFYLKLNLNYGDRYCLRRTSIKSDIKNESSQVRTEEYRGLHDKMRALELLWGLT